MTGASLLPRLDIRCIILFLDNLGRCTWKSSTAMAPYNNHYGSRYDPVGSQYNQQHHQSYYASAAQQPTAAASASTQRASTQTPQPQSQSQSSAPPGYQSSYTAGYTGQPYYNYQSTESRAAETLSHLSAQSHNRSSSRPTATQYDNNNNSRSDSSSWNAPERASTQQQESSTTSWHNADRRGVANPPPVYQHEQPPASATSSYSPAQSYSQPPTTTMPSSTYSYASYSQSEQSRAPASTTPAQPSSYDFSTSGFRASSPYLAHQQQQQQQQQQEQQQKQQRAAVPQSSISSLVSNTTRDRQSSNASHAAANVSQPRAPSVTPSSIQSSSYGRHSAPRDQGYSSAPTTVDPTQVYDPWPEQQRKLAEARRKAEAEEKRKAEEEAKRVAEEEEKRKAEEELKRKAEEEARRKAEEEARKQAEEQARRDAELEAKRKAEEEARRKAEEAARQKAEEERKAAENLRLARGTANIQGQRKATTYGRPYVNPVVSGLTTVMDTRRMLDAAMARASTTSTADGGGNLETEMAAIFRRMRDLNSADPQMFARMWETERQAHLVRPAGATQSPANASPAPNTVPAAPAPPRAQPVPVSTRPQFKPAPQAPTMSAPNNRPPVPVTAGPSSARQQANPVKGSLPATTGGLNSIWPPGKKATLADTATKWLNARKENINKLVSVEEILALLAPNPSYLTLCESLERMGLYVDRSQFARALLSVVPDAAKTNKNPPRPALPTPQPPTPVEKLSTDVVGQSSAVPKKHNNSKSRHPSRAAIASLQDRHVVDLTGPESGPSTTSSQQPYQPHAQHNDASVVAYQSKFEWASSVDDTPGYTSSYTRQPPQPAPIQNLQSQPRKVPSPYSQQPGQASASASARPTPLPPAPRPPPANKNEAARKRNFGELVDMTALDSDSDQDMPPKKQANIGQYDMGVPTEQLSGGKATNAFDRSVSLQQYYFNAPVYPTNLSAGPPMPSTNVASRPPILSRYTELRNKTLVQPITRAKVARKSRYDPRTICRDVLLATGRHPDMRPLNQHLNVLHMFLKSHSEHVEQDKFDLETIRWDLIDPGEPIVEAPKPAEVDVDMSSVADEANADDADNEGGSEDEGSAQVASAVPPPRVTESPVTTDGTPVASGTKKRESTARLVAVQIGSSTKGNRGTTKSPFPKNKIGRPRRSFPIPAAAAGKSSAKAAAVAGRASGGSRNNNSNPSPNALPSSSTPRAQRQTTSMSTPPIPGQPIGYAAFRSNVVEVDENGNPVKKKGRPVGWRKSLHSKAALTAATAGESGDGMKPPESSAQRASRGQAVPSYAAPKQRRPKQSKAVPETKEADVEFSVFKCEWEDCGAELHNIDTLRKHVVKIHGLKTSEGDFECAWLGCFHEDEVTAFDDMGTWMEHMESTHVKPITRQLGDGPRAGLSGGF
jgi:hypothetical protein